jgi:hypothetical protein
VINRAAIISGWLATVALAAVYTWTGNPLAPHLASAAVTLGVIALAVRSPKS